MQASRRSVTANTAARSKSKTEAAIAGLEISLVKKAHFFDFDLVDLAAVRKIAKAFESQEIFIEYSP
ncbi:hypothetical protein SCHPADRAFT_908193 [Schizopora paradoxa]|uniref:Uncharacterized protein n=1 Tax=Schizopora paradoxa TaxID=27342 RepID=A0A0H2RB12_9AGAM|nr:hypothetical protein SCHPADRAFT_908193 [Schizopora paradoxa]